PTVNISDLKSSLLGPQILRLSWSLLAVLLCLTALFSSPRIIHNAQAATAPTFGLDGKGVDTSDWGSHQGYRSQLLTTTQPNDVIILIVESHPPSLLGYSMRNRLYRQPSRVPATDAVPARMILRTPAHALPRYRPPQ